MWRVTEWELRKLAAQKRTYLGVVAALVTPVAMIGTFSFQDKLPLEYPFGRFLHLTGYATSYVLIGFVAVWLLPLLVCLVAGDIFAAEDSESTWKLLLTRSMERRQVFVGKVVAAAIYAVLLLVGLAASAIISGGLRFGFVGLIDLSGQEDSAGRALLLTLLAWLLTLPAVMAFVAFGLFFSIVTRNSAAGVVAPVVVALGMSLAGSLGGVGRTRHYLLTAHFESFHGLLHTPTYDAEIWRAVWVPLLYIVATLVPAYLVFRSRDVTDA